jgi:hypothetical protein
MKSYALSGTSTPSPAAGAPAQDLGRHKPKASANHLSTLEQVKRDAERIGDDVAELERVQATRPLRPPGRRG